SCLFYYFIVLRLSGNWIGVGIGHLLIAFPYAMILFGSYWNESHRAMEQLVYTLGGSPRQAFWKALVPASGGILTLCFFQTFLISWFEYGLTTLLGVGKVQTLTVSVYQYVGEANLYLAAVSCVWIFLPPVLMLWINRRALIRKGAASL
ncbi:MAG: ABC transporter permease, partial [Bacteroidetes bacterium]